MNCKKSVSGIMYLLFVLLAGLAGCAGNDAPPDNIQRVLEEAGKNKKELEKVITHYSRNAKDSLKLKAAYFIIENIEGMVTLDTASVASNKKYFGLLGAIWDIDKKKVFSKSSKAIDSLNKTLKAPPASPKVVYLNELSTVTAGFLISNIDSAFYIWEHMPWAKNVSFADFCEYILPYRCSNTYSVTGRNYFLNKYSTLPDSIRNSASCIKAGGFIISDIDSWFTEDVDILPKYPYLNPIKFSDLLKGRIGACNDANSVRVTALRALGIPAAFDMLPNWGNNNAPHFWYRILDPLHDTVKTKITNKNENKSTQYIISASSFDAPFFEGTPANIQINYNRSVPKVYRECFSKQPNSLAAIKSPAVEVPIYFSNTHLKDVTDEYIECTNITLRLNNSVPDQSFAYLCVFDNQQWWPVAWAMIKDSTAGFEKIGKNIVYLPAYFKGGKVIPAGNPFLLTLDGHAREISPAGKTEQVKLYTKYPLRSYVINYESYMLGGRFQFANKPDFSDSVNVHVIKTLPFYKTEVKVKPLQKFRYLLYQFKGVPKTYISEIQFYGLDNKGKEIKLVGKLIGNPGAYPYVAENICDDKWYNLYKAAENSESYIGIDCGTDGASVITKIIYMPYTDDNAIIAGDTYELFYWNNTWVSCGESKAYADKSVVFKHIPGKALLLVKNKKGGNQQRIFLYENGRQVFW